jgi:hypothetical protein
MERVSHKNMQYQVASQEPFKLYFNTSTKVTMDYSHFPLKVAKEGSCMLMLEKQSGDTCECLIKMLGILLFSLT